MPIVIDTLTPDKHICSLRLLIQLSTSVEQGICGEMSHHLHHYNEMVATFRRDTLWRCLCILLVLRFRYGYLGLFHLKRAFPSDATLKTAVGPGFPTANHPCFTLGHRGLITMRICTKLEGMTEANLIHRGRI